MECCERHLLALGAVSAPTPADGLGGDAVSASDLMGGHHDTNQRFLASVEFEEHAAFHLAEAAAAADAARSHRIDGASTLAGWSSYHARTARPDTNRHVRRGRAIAAYPELRAAWSAHRISAAHVDAFVRLIDPDDAVRAALLDRDEELLVGTATDLTVEEFVRVLKHWEAMADPDGHEESWAASHDRRHLSTARDFDGNLVFRGQLEAAEGDAVMKALDELEKRMFEADWAEARARLGRTPKISELRRTKSNRRADALVVLICGGSDSDPLRPDVSIDYVIDHNTFEETLERLERGSIGVCQSDDIEWIPHLPNDSLADLVGDHLPDTRRAFDPLFRSETFSARPLPPTVIVADALRARVRRVVFQGPNVVANAGRSRRLFSATQRRLVSLVRQRCSNPYCDRPSWECEIDHAIPWDAGGTTDLDNAQPLCPQDHREKSKAEREQARLRIRADGNLELR